jgi:hypothetical protein
MFRFVIACVIPLAILLVVAPTTHSAEPKSSPEEIKAAVNKALPLLWKGAEGHVAQKTCFACHNQGVPILAFTTAREHGFTIAAEDLTKQVDFIAAFLEKNRDDYRQGKGTGGQADTAGYALLALEVGGTKPDATSEAVVEYLLQRNRDLDHWRASGNRPPSEASDFSPTYLALRALRHWGAPTQQERIRKRIAAVRPWLLETSAKDTEDRVFRLWALQAAGAEEKDVQAAVQELVQTQNKDGGWKQTEELESDAYATGSALVALHETGHMAVSGAAYQRGVAFLLQTQRPDGSWLVHTRSRPVQTYYESGFPHGKDQFISMAASGWATTALALACPRADRNERQEDRMP